MGNNERGDDPKKIKIFPRNLTARADYVVRGNPANSRPESGVENCFPGLEFDQRNLDQRFFPGLYFEYQRADGAILLEINLDEGQKSRGLQDADLSEERPLYLWALYGRALVEDEDPTLFGFRGLSGMEVWRRVRDLLPGRVAILFGPTPGFNNMFDSTLALQELEAAYKAQEDDKKYVVRRDPDGKIKYAVFSRERARYLDDYGVIDTKSYAPGEITKSMCAPWMYDFRDCYCFYWSSNKPDIVDSADGKTPYLNFIRKDRSTDPPQQDVIYYIDGNKRRRDLELTYADMVEGWWQKLPVILNDRESVEFTPLPQPPITELLDRDEVINELNYLATVEHALIVEYLYAHYSVNAPFSQPEFGTAENIGNIFASANEIFLIAIDEMRHFLWANEVLNILGAPPSTGRAKVIGKPPQHGDGRKIIPGKSYLDVPFALNTLTPETLQWFIDVEAPSQVAGQQLDGMYVRLLVSIDRQREVFPEYDRIIPVIKLLIDEGDGHFHRFSAVQKTLAGIPQSEYLRGLENKPNESQKKLLGLCDLYYHSILEAIQISFSLGKSASEELLKAAIRSMISLHEAGHKLASEGIGVQFNLPTQAPSAKRLTLDEANDVIRRRAEKVREQLVEIAKSEDDAERAMADRHKERSAMVYERMQRIVNDEK